MGWSSGLKGFFLGVSSVKPVTAVTFGLSAWLLGALLGFWF